MKPEKTYYCEVDIKFGGNSFEAKSKEEYIKKVKNSFKEEFNIELKDNEIKKATKKDISDKVVQLKPKKKKTRKKK